jgi:hypothetical protein
MDHGRECHHCKQWVADGEPHDCWSTTEAALTRDLHDDLQDAYDRLREAAVDLGEQRIYASHHSIMFSRKACFCFVRPRRAWLEVCVFLGREIAGPLVRSATRVSKTKVAHLVRITHRDQVEPPLTDWMREAYEFAGRAPAALGPASAPLRRAAQPALPSQRAAKKR